MPKKKTARLRRDDSLSPERIIQAAIALLDSDGEAGLTFRALSEALETGAGAIYWHIDNKHDLLIAASDAVIVRTLADSARGTAPEAAIRALALGVFDAIDAHPWIGAAMTRVRKPGQSPILRIVERLGQQVQALGVAQAGQRAAVSALLDHILGVGGRNAARGEHARARGIDRDKFLQAEAAQWLQLDANEYPFLRSIAADMRTHDDRADFLAGIDLILAGIAATLKR